MHACIHRYIHTHIKKDGNWDGNGDGTEGSNENGDGDGTGNSDGTEGSNENGDGDETGNGSRVGSRNGNGEENGDENTQGRELEYRSHFSFPFFFFHLTYSRWTSSSPSCLWSQRTFPSLPGSRLTIFLSRCKFSTLTTRQPMVEFYLLTFPRFPLRKKEHKSYFGKNRTHDFRTSRCAAYLLDHSGDERYYTWYNKSRIRGRGNDA